MTILVIFLALYPLFLARQEFKNSGIPMPSLVFIQLILHAKLGKAWVLEIFLEKKKDSCDIMEWRHIF